MKYDDALEAREILNKIEPLREFVNVINRKLNVLGTARVILEINDSAENSDYPEPIRIELSQKLVKIVKEELSKELHDEIYNLYKLGEDISWQTNKQSVYT